MADPASYRPAPGTIPTQPGVYRFSDPAGTVIYVGKAKNLRQRLNSYFADPAALHFRTQTMVRTAAKVEWTVVQNELESLQLEYTWIKQYDPRFNIKYRDDKSYPWVCVTWGEEFPRVFVGRGAKRKGNRYYGPYAQAWAIRETIDSLLRVFPMRSCTNGVFRNAKASGRPCLLAHIGKCSAPCVGRIDEEDHRDLVEDLCDFLAGNTNHLTKRLRRAMLEASDGLEFEKAAVLRDNYDQNVLLANAKAQRSGMVGPHLRFMNWLSERGELDRELEFLPSDEVIEERVTRGSALTTPELSVLVAYSKLALKRDLIETSLPDQPWLDRYVAEYFPAALTDRFSDRLASHPLRREIVVNSLANALVNRGGITFVFRAQEETDSSVARIVQAYAIAAEVFDQPSYLAAVEALDNVVSTDTQASLYLAFRRLLDRTVRWWVTNRPASLDIGAEIDRFAGAVAQLGPRISSLLPEGELAEFEAAMQGWVEQGVPEETARSAATLMYLFSCLDIVELAQEAQKGTADGASESARDANDELDAVADVYFAALGRFRVGELLNHVGDLDREDRWAALARASLRDDLYDVLKSITRVVLASTDASQPAEQRVESWAGSHDEILSRLAVMMRSIEGLEDVGLAPVSVAVRSLRGVVRAASVLA